VEYIEDSDLMLKQAEELLDLIAISNEVIQI